MPLIICQKCGCIENTHLVNKNYTPTVYNYTGDENHFYPFLSRMEMDGYDKEAIVVNGKTWKEPKETMYICSECNTGTWHGEFEKTFPSEETKILALFSKANFITPYDQDDISYIKDNDNEDCGYRPNMQYYYILKLYRKFIKDEKFQGDIIKDLRKRSNLIIPSTETYKEHISYHNFLLIIDLLKEEEDNFHLSLQGDFRNENIDWSDTRDIALILLDSVIDETKAKGLWKTLYTYHNANDEVFRQKIFEYKHFKHRNTPYDGSDIYNNVLKMVHQLGLNKYNKKPHWKDIQSEDDKNEKLRKAEEKRQRKLNRSM